MRVSLEIPKEHIKFHTTHCECVEIVLEEDNSKYPTHITEALEKLDLTDDELTVVERSVNAILLARKIKSWVKFKE